MNSNLLRTRVARTLFVAAAAVVLTVSNPLTSLANGGNKNTRVNEDQVTVQYVGVSNDNVVFRVTFDNPTTEKFWLIVKNDAGEVIYRKQFSDAHFAKSISLQKDGADIHPTFVIRNAQGEVSRQFAVTNTVTENTIITEL